MSKYLKETTQKEKCLSKYIEKADEQKTRELKYLMEVLGDVKLDKDMMEIFHRQFHCSGGRYSVRTKPETIRGIYSFTRRFKELSVDAVEEVWFRYITDLFEEYELEDMLDMHFKVFGKKDETFDLFIEYIDKNAEQHQQKYKDEAKRLKELEDEYSEEFISHLKSLIIREHFSLDEIKKYLPSAELIKKDENHISEISSQTRIFFGCCLPVSYKMFDILLEKKELDTFTETPTYYISTGRQEKAKFTKTEFLESIKEKQKVLKK